MGRPATPLGQHGMISFREENRKSGRVYVATTYHRDPDGKSRPVTASGRTKPIAQSALLKKLEDRIHQRPGATVKSMTTIGDLAVHYVEALGSTKRLKAQTRARYAQSAKNAISRAFREVRVAELTPGMVEVFINGLANSGHLSEARNSRVVLKQMLRLAVIDRAINVNPVVVADIRLPLAGKKARALTTAELVQLRDLVAGYRTGESAKGPKQSPDLRDALDTMLGSGLRISEVLALRVEDVEVLEDGRARIAVNGTIIYEDGVGSVRQDSTKGGRDRYLVVAAWLGTMLVERASRSRSGLLWETRRTAKAYQQQNLLRDLRKIVAGTELAWLSSHDLRKTAGTAIALSLGVPAATSALGHSSDVVTRRTYLDEEQLATDVSGALEPWAPQTIDQLDEGTQNERQRVS